MRAFMCNKIDHLVYYLVNTMTEYTDESIATEVQNGNIDAYGELISRYEKKLKRYARKFLSRDEDIEDLVQDVFIKSYEHIQSFDSKQRFSPWIYRIAHNTFVNELRRKGRYGMGVFDADTILPHIPAKETADADVLDAELKDELDSLIQNLSPKYREVIVLHYFEELSYREISDVLQIPITTVGVRMSRARRKLQETFNKKEI
jgi:RNA polymerase sigma factor (sigma-70 family)